MYRLIKDLYDYDFVFDGYKIATITKSPKEPEISDLVSQILTKLGYLVIEVINDSTLRETSHFFNRSLPILLSKTEEGVLYYCHSKGITYHPDSELGRAAKLWTETLLTYTLRKYDNLPLDDASFDTFGTCIIRSANFLPDKIGEQFSYVGTFFWIRLSLLANKDFKPTSKFYLEGLPGLVSDPSRAFSVGPEFNRSENPYILTTWNNKGIYDEFQR